jgi:hypothetical protein
MQHSQCNVNSKLLLKKYTMHSLDFSDIKKNITTIFFVGFKIFFVQIMLFTEKAKAIC